MGRSPGMPKSRVGKPNAMAVNRTQNTALYHDELFNTDIKQMTKF